MLHHQVVSRSQLASGPVQSSNCTWSCQAEASGDLREMRAHLKGQVLPGASRKFTLFLFTRDLQDLQTLQTVFRTVLWILICLITRIRIGIRIK
jgi:hypothetical protein